ncbi:cytochrome c oxidase assembly protein COX18, mitochondrial [Helicoverpa armigera]|uniref:cytochrome c oxidase assembly protein COX18, mitochondrial n=1 Tax=Helicoverpa armigera TaxID=29058 RepID=UPI0030832A73
MTFYKHITKLKINSTLETYRKFSVICNNHLVAVNNENRAVKCNVLKGNKLCSFDTRASRNFSMEAFAKWQEQTYASISGSTPVHFMQDGLLYFHDLTGMPWWATIVTSTILIRTCMTLPLSVYQNYILAKVENISLELKDMVNELKKETTIAKKVYNLTDKQAVLLYKRSLKKQWNNLIVRDNCHPFKASLLIWFQLPVWVCMSFALRNLVYTNSPDPAALVTLMELSTGGIGWIPNLTEPDHSWILPVAFGLTNLSIIEIQRLSKLRQPSKLYNVFTNVFRVFTIIMIPVAANVPSCMCLYWMTSSSIGLVHNLILLSPSIRRKLRIPLAPSELEEPYKHIKEELKDSFRRKLKRNMLKES